MPDSTAACPRPVLRTRSLVDAGLGGEPIEVVKCDGRSRVWFVTASGGGGRHAVKRFEHSSLRQMASLLLHVHPAQRELRWNRRLGEAGVPVVPIVDAGIERAGAGCRAWLATPDAGTSLQRRLRDLDDRPGEAEALLEQAADLALTLLGAGCWLKDFKPSNIIVDDVGAARLIDVGGTRRYGEGDGAERMLAVMERALAREGVDEPRRRRFAERVHGAIRAGADAA